jgi:hypothetical protein
MREIGAFEAKKLGAAVAGLVALQHHEISQILRSTSFWPNEPIFH